MPLYRDDSFLVVHPGSQNTLFSFGLQDSLSPPQYKIPTVVYRDSVSKEYRSKKEDGENLVAVYPIKGSRIVDLDAFNYLLKIILQSVISNNPIITINQVPLLIVAPALIWSRFSVEYITKFVFETLEFTAFNILETAIASTFAIGAGSSALVVNVGHESATVTPVLNYQVIKFAAKFLPSVGGHTINSELSKLLPHFSDAQIEALKTSSIYEVLNDTEGSYYSFAELNEKKPNDDDDDFDVATFVTKDGENGTKLAVDDEAKQQEEEESKPNSELEKNSFLDPTTGEKLYVGKERFQGTSKLVSALSTAIYSALSLIPDLEKRQECYENIIFVGSTFGIAGLKRAVLAKLVEEHLIKPPTDKSRNTNDNKDTINSAIASYQQLDDPYASPESSGLVQVPTIIKTVKYPEYFPEWKKPKEKNGSWDDVYFLGGQIYAKQIFGGNYNYGGDSFIDADIYEERGPSAIWDVSL